MDTNEQMDIFSNIFIISSVLTHWGQVTHICVCKLTIIGSDNGLSPDRRQATIWTNAWLLLIGPLGTNFSEIVIEILAFSFKKMHLKVSSAKRRPFCPSLNVLRATHAMYRHIGFLLAMPLPLAYSRNGFYWGRKWADDVDNGDGSVHAA